MKKEQVMKILLIVVAVALVLFIIFNVDAFLKMRDFKDLTKNACKNFVDNGNCKFILKNVTVNGTCVREKNGDLVCRPRNPLSNAG